MNYYDQNIEDVLKILETNRNGLSNKEAALRLKKYGTNNLPRSTEKVTRLKIFLSQFSSPFIFILLIAGIISGILGEAIDMMVIFITVAINTLIGFVQEDKANQALKKIHAMVEYQAIVIRDGHLHQIKSQEIVPGDILVIGAGNKIQADGRLLKASDLEINEAVLTGESEPNKKSIKTLKGDMSVIGRSNMVFCGTVAINGRALAIVTGTGKNTEIGKIASLVKETEEEQTPLQMQLSKLSRNLAIIVLFTSIIIFLFGVFFAKNGESILEMFQVTVAVAVAAIPEGLLITLTVILAVGMRHVLKRRALVRKLVAVETLGSVSVICTDKTGTITEGNMRLTNLITSVDNLDFEEIKTLNPNKEERHKEAMFGLHIGVLCNDGVLEHSLREEKEWRLIGDTTDLAFLHMGAKVGYHKEEMDDTVRRLDEIIFSSERKYMATAHHIDNKYAIYVKGAPEVLLKKCNFFEDDGKTKKMTKQKYDWFKEKINELTENGLRVLVLAYKHGGEVYSGLAEKDIEDLSLVCIVGLSDPLRTNVKETIYLAHRAGIKTVMLTGDHIKTAQAVARQIGLSDKMDNIFDGQRLEKMSDDELALSVKTVSIFARIDPVHKIRIVRAFQSNGEVVAMTGDGVNDAPALKAADIGIALGSGSDVAKEVADIVLLDDAYSTIVASVDEGRGIYQNVKKVLLYLLASSFSEVALIAACLLARLPLAVLPAQILWVNIIEDSFPNMALAFDKGDNENMEDGPRRKDEPLLDTRMKVMISIVTIVSNAVLFILFLYFLRTVPDLVKVRTLMFVGLGIASLIYIYSVRSMRRMVWQNNPFSNNYLNMALLFSWLMLIGAVYFQPMQILLRTVPIGWREWGIMLMFGILNMILIEIVKGFFLVKKNWKTAA